MITRLGFLKQIAFAPLALLRRSRPKPEIVWKRMVPGENDPDNLRCILPSYAAWYNNWLNLQGLPPGQFARYGQLQLEVSRFHRHWYGVNKTETVWQWEIWTIRSRDLFLVAQGETETEGRAKEIVFAVAKQIV